MTLVLELPADVVRHVPIVFHHQDSHHGTRAGTITPQPEGSLKGARRRTSGARGDSGFLNLGLHLRKEWNHNGNLGQNESYDVDFNVEPVWHFPFQIGGARFAFDGFADYNTPKGRDAAGRDTRAEFIARPLLKLDISPVVGRKVHVLELGVGFQYYHNMFGKDADWVPGADELTPVFALAVHLPLGGAGH
jgi:hypothetical protein